MGEWEPITQPIQIGDIVGQRMYPQYEYEITDIRTVESREQVKINWKNKDIGWFHLDIFQMCKIPQTTYNPEQQPYEEGDI